MSIGAGSQPAAIVREIQGAVDTLRLSLGVGHDAAWFLKAFGPCDRLLREMSSDSGRMGPPVLWNDDTVAPDRLSLDAARTISTVLVELANRMRTGVFQEPEGAPLRDTAALFIERVYFDVLKAIFSMYPELTPKELRT